MNTLPSTSIHELIERNCLVTELQPLISMNRKSLLGFEALTRAVDPYTGKWITPFELFSMCEDLWTLTRLDRACRRKAFETFAPFSKKDRTLLLSVNIDAAIISNSTIKLGLTEEMVNKYEIPPNNVILEIIESKAGSDEILGSFVKNSRRQGFLIALDDIGTGHSNLDRIPKLQPDIIKIDRSLIKDIDQKFHNLEVTRALINLAERTGCLPLAEGVETAKEALTLMSLGVDVFQGYYFGKPMPAAQASCINDTPIKTIAARFKTHVMETLAARKLIENTYKKMIRKLRYALHESSISSPDQILSTFITENSSIECAYILDTDGIQISKTVCNPFKLKESRRLIYEPAPLGADHSLKEYYLTIKSGKRWHNTCPYISLASGNNCVTISTKIADTDNSPILCIDIST